jgi:hypothetical protein
MKRANSAKYRALVDFLKSFMDVKSPCILISESTCIRGLKAAFAEEL